jgi:hypothetical protein
MGAYPYEPLIDLSDPKVMLGRVAAMTAAVVSGRFWLPCPLCGVEFSGLEWMRGTGEKPADVHLPGDPPGILAGICPFCTAAGRGALPYPAAEATGLAARHGQGNLQDRRVRRRDRHR